MKADYGIPRILSNKYQGKLMESGSGGPRLDGHGPTDTFSVDTPG